MEQGSIEYLVDVEQLIQDLEGIGYTPVQDFKMTDYADSPKLNKLRRRLHYKQRLISQLHRVIILKRTQVGGYFDKYREMKKKYLALKHRMGDAE